ncbi:hypothetical protein [Nakamurella sp. PAMC28650]|uniref:hypothetical protein n=1 Tax=Nakamurella sp. PAMC28650 TaxID=2762325 RepID=UPI00164DEC97|nr:hypothetical protein [Nakamurella sp. PAMC28650]QNK81403.1 hypothetical protein H7F38_00605 [Nakamurella sp. PAMC28650]
MDLDSNESVRSELRRLKPDGDLVAVADDMRRRGVDSLLLCRSGGRIARVVSEHRVRRLAQPQWQSAQPLQAPQAPPKLPVPGVAFLPGPGLAQSPASSPEGEGVRAQTG